MTMTELELAVRRGDHASIFNLLNHGANPNDFSGPLSPLCAAIVAKSTAWVDLLLRFGADPNAVCIGSTPLHLVASDGVVEMISPLIASRANPDALDSSGFTPLEIAASLSHKDVFERLLPHTTVISWYTIMTYDVVKSELSSPHVYAQRKLKLVNMNHELYEQAVRLYKSGETCAALTQVTTVISECPYHAQALLLRAAINVDRSDATDALQDIEACVDVNPSMWNDINVYAIMAQAQWIQKNFKVALHTCEEGLKLDPSHVKLQELQSRAILALQKLEATYAC